MANDDTAPITKLLSRWRDGDEATMEQIIPAVYDELHRVARSYMRRNPSHHTLQATSLVNEAFCRLPGIKSQINDRAHFIGIVAHVMRQILVDHARAKSSIKRGGDLTPVELQESDMTTSGPSVEVLALEEVLTAIGEKDPRKVKIAELHYFCGMTVPETAQALDVSRSTVEREVRMLKALLLQSLSAM